MMARAAAPLLAGLLALPAPVPALPLRRGGWGDRALQQENATEAAAALLQENVTEAAGEAWPWFQFPAPQPPHQHAWSLAAPGKGKQVDATPEEEMWMNAKRLAMRRTLPEHAQSIIPITPGPMCYETTESTPVNTCKMSATERCSIKSMAFGASTMVYPGGQTRCISNNKPEYAFQVVPGRLDKLFLLFDGGGAVWNKLSWELNAANKTRVKAVQLHGLLRHGPKSERNPLRDYTLVLVQYCSGDLHSGDATASFKDEADDPIIQTGYHNTMAAIQWAKENVNPQLDAFVISGMSAGALATALWSRHLLSEFHYRHATVIADSYLGVLPPTFQSLIFQVWGICHLQLLSPAQAQKCNSKGLSLPDLMDEAIRDHPNVAFASVSSKYDWAQTLYHRLASMTVGEMTQAVNYNKRNFFQEGNTIVARWNKHPNFVTYMMHSDIHIFQACDHVFDFVQTGYNGNSERFVDWLARLPAIQGDHPSAEALAAGGKRSRIQR